MFRTPATTTDLNCKGYKNEKAPPVLKGVSGVGTRAEVQSGGGGKVKMKF